MSTGTKKILYQVIVIISAFLVPSPSVSQNINISFLNTTEGDAIFLQSAKVRFMIDAGPPAVQKSVLEKAKDGDLSIIITHPHPDHYGGMFYLQTVANIKAIYDNGESLLKMQEGRDYAAWYSSVIRSHKNYKALKKGDVPHSDSSFKIEVLWPPDISDTRDYNENSLVLLITAYNRKILLMGDAPATVENIFVKEGIAPSNIDVLKIGHHAAEHVAREEFLLETSPRFSIITGSANPRYHYENHDTVNRLEKHSDRVLSTRHAGTIVYTVQPNGQDELGAK